MPDNHQSENIIESADYDPALIANYFISMGMMEDALICPMKMLKLVYVAYAWYYTIFGKTLFKEDVQAWKLGPVVPSLYHEFKRFGSRPIDVLATQTQDKGGEIQKPLLPLLKSTQVDLARLLPLVWSTYKDKSASEMSDITHEEGSAWCKAKNKGYNIRIKPDDMKERSSEKLREVLRAP